MSAAAQPEEGRTIDRLCDEFEAEWQAGGRPTIESYLGRVAPGLRGRLLRELLALEMEYRLRQGERPGLGEYQQRFVADADTVAAAFAQSVQALAGTATAAGPATLTLKVVEGPNQGQSFVFGGAQTFLVGRSRKAHLAVPDDKYLSRFHFLVEVNPPNCRLTDLHSRSGTLVNGQRVESVELRAGDAIKAGRTLLRVEGAAAASGEDLDALATFDESAPPTDPAADPNRTQAPSTARPNPEPADPYRTDPPAPAAPAASLPPEAAADLPPIKGYQLERELGRGGMGVVYLARREADGQRVALKTIKPAVTGQPRQIQRFLREADILRELRHHHIVSFLEAGECDGLLFFAMEYIEGTDAARVLQQQGQLAVREATRVVCQLLSALKYAHERRFVHRDIKPANLLIAEEKGKKSVKLADFGLARVYQESQLSGLTMLGDVGGTVAFMPPEQITRFRQVNPAADQYSAAATLYNLLTGQYLFDFQAAKTKALALVLQGEPVPIRKRRPELPEELAVAVHRALAKEPGERFPGVPEFREALLPFAK